MKYVKTTILFALILTSVHASPENGLRLSSPDGNLVFTFRLTPDAPMYEILFKGEKLINDSKLGLVFKKEGRFASDLGMGEPAFTEVDESYELIVGKAKKVRDHHKQVIIPLTERSGTKRKIHLVVRAFNDGLAFRYEIPGQPNWESYELLGEESTFNINGNPTLRGIFWDTYTNSHEGPIRKIPFEEVTQDSLLDLPALFEFSDHTFMAITEANLRDYASLYLKKEGGQLKSQLSPLPGQTATKVKASLPHSTPWRVFMIGDRIGGLIESNMLAHLNDPTKLTDISWIKPGKTTFHWWNGDIVPDSTFAPGNNFETNKYYIDFAARNNIEYHAVIGYGGVPWYKSDAASYGVIGEHTDVTETVPTIDMKKIAEYAKGKGVGIHVWVHWKAIYPGLEKAFKQFHEWGINGMMVDFMNRDDQEMINIQEEILQKAAKYQLYIQFHGSNKPTGLSRTYPNEFTREAAYNYEYNKFSEKPITPAHDLDIAFTRLLAGPTDYHLGGFRAVPATEWKEQYTRPLMIGTRAHMLAMYVVMESYLGSLCDYPEAYEGKPGFKFLKEVPTVWDETVVPTAEIDEFVTVARRKGNNWFIGTLNNSKAKDIDVSLDFLPPGTYRAEIYADAPDAEQNPNHLKIYTKELTNSDTITLNLAADGGNAIKLTKCQSAPPGSVSFAVLSDSHIGKPGNDTSLELVVDAINRNPEISFVIHAGDASDFGSPGQLKEAKRILDQLDKPYLIVPGNHDTYWSDNAGASFTDLWGGQEFVKDINGIRFIGISTGPYARATVKGYVPKGQLAWLEKTLASTPPQQPIILIAHIPLLDTYVSNYQEVLSVLKDHHVRMVFSGHGHSNKIVNENGFKSLMTTTTQFRNGLTAYNQITLTNDSLTAKAIFPKGGNDTVWTRLALMDKSDIQAELSKLSVSEAGTDKPESVKITWDYVDNGNIISTPVASRKNVLFGNMLGEFKSVNTQNSKINWTYETEGPIYSSPAISGDKVVFGSVDSTIYCLDVHTGAKRWELKTDAPVLASPIIEGGMVFIGGSDHTFRAIELNSGEASWIFPNVEGAVFMKPAIAGETVVFGTWHNKLYALDKNDGSLSWSWGNSNQSQYYSPAICVPVIMDTLVYVVTPEGLLRGFDLATGALVSETEEQGLWESLGGDIKKKRLLAKTNNGTVVGWKIDGGMPRKFLELSLETGQDLSPSIPIIHKNSGFFGSNSGAVFSIDLSKKKINWSFDMSDNMVNTLSRFSKGILLASSIDGRLVLFEEK